MNTENLLDLAKASFRNGDFTKASDYCNSYISSYPSDSAGLRFMAILLGRDGKTAEAVSLISEVIELDHEPCDYFYRGRWYLRNKDIMLSINDFSIILEIEAKNNKFYYSEDARLHRAYAYVMVGMDVNAMNDLEQIDEECQTSINNIVISKNDLLAEILRTAGKNRPS